MVRPVTIAIRKGSLPAAARKIAQLPAVHARLIASLSLLSILALWLITPTPKHLHDPKSVSSIQDNYDAGSQDIQNSIIVPTYNEAENLEPLVSRIYQALPPEQVRHTEVLIVDDDSKDNTVEIVDRLREGGYNLRLEVRKNPPEGKGLSSAVLHGFKLARGDRLLVMDADLQHPPENVWDLLSALPDDPNPGSSRVNPPQFALASRYDAGNSIDKDWPMYRRIISWGARTLSRPLTNAKDPMGGFFALRRSLYLQSQPLNPSGFKIALELLLKTPLRSAELVHVPYKFTKRQHGSSKLGAKVILKYVGQLLALYYWRFGLLWFLFVGFTVAVVASVGIAMLQAAVIVLDLEDKAWARWLGARDSAQNGNAHYSKKKKRRLSTSQA